ncbi:class I SAM-dependent methyltransferase [Lactobacillus sp. YT155]|uniref:class I SAM-dependent methyltransferase n=1 Tax=Lactobacillus sp. YT155 TaxID=3060955 RepID=UPI00265D9BC6|nr:class I SAM-dependent methyltransferase [Lactobacillus sp. YT155]MDO1605029.1 class I SAM-dependent methyltransferase [Lactobacillus sp. YT155]
MTNNNYDNEDFFEKYSEMSRSRLGLSGAGEWPTLEKIMPDLKGKDFLDLGCGYGWHCFYAAEHGANKIVGVDLSKKMLEVANKKNTSKKIEFINADISNIEFPENSFDIVFSSLTFHYLESYEEMILNIKKYLKPEGQLIFSVEHPIFTAQGTQDWNYDERGEIKDFPVDNYFYEGKRDAIFLGEHVTKYHRTLTTYLEDLLKNDFKVEHIIEPMPPQSMMDEPGMKDEMRRPMMLIISAKNSK